MENELKDMIIRVSMKYGIIPCHDLQVLIHKIMNKKKQNR